MKRANSNGQQRREDFENEDDDNGDANQGMGEFQRASEENLTGRKIFKANRIAKEPLESSQPVSNAMNPFASFSTKPVASTASLSNPFSAAFGTKINPPAVSSNTGITAFQTSNNKEFTATPVSLTTNIRDLKSSSSSVDTSANYEVKMEKLNKSFLSWMEQQIIDHPISIWKDGVGDYINYSESIRKKFKPKSNSTSIPPAKIEPSSSSFAPSFPISKSQTIAPVENNKQISFSSNIATKAAEPIAAPFVSAPVATAPAAVAAAAKPFAFGASNSSSMFSSTVPTFGFPPAVKS